MDSPQNVYAKCLPNDRGYPLRFPESNATLPSSYRQDGLQIGDVGFVSQSGEFSVICNVCYGPNHALHQRPGVSFTFDPIALDIDEIHVVSDAEPPGCVITSPGIVPIGPHRAGHYKFTASATKGAILILPDGATSHNVVNDERFRKVLMEHASDWYEIAKEHYGESINGSLYLITGFYKARSWSLASFHDAIATEPRLIEVVPREGEGTTTWRDWRCTFPLDYRDGPGPSHNGNVNQTVFISGLKIAVRDDVFGWLSQKPEIQPVPAVQPRGNGLLGILPYLFRASTQTKAGSKRSRIRPQPPDEMVSISEVRVNKAPDSTMDQPTTSRPSVSKAHSEASDNDLLEAPIQEEPGLETPQDKPQQQHRQPSTLDVHDNEAPNSTPDQPTMSSPTQEEPGLETPQDKLQQQHEQPFASEVHDKEQPGSTQEQPTTSSSPESRTHHEDSDNDLLEVELPSSTPKPIFNYEEPPSPASSAGSREVECSLQTTPQLPEALPMPRPPELHQETPCDVGESSRVTPAFTTWFQTRFKKTYENQASQPSDQLSTKSGHPVNLGCNSQSQPTANIAQNGQSRFAAGKRSRRTIGVNLSKKATKAAKQSHAVKDASSSGQGSAGTKEVGAGQQANEARAVTGVHVTHEAGDATISIVFKLRAWMLCLRSGTEDGRH